MLSSYRVLDLSDEKGQYCGKMLADLGCDVVKIEKPAGDRARSIGPFYHDDHDPEKSLFWLAYNTNKRSVTLDIETGEGRETFKKLVSGSDVVLESFTPGYLDNLGLGYRSLKEINPGIIMASITPFGQAGPYKDYLGPDIVVSAMSGFMYQHGYTDGAPLRFSAPQSYLLASADAAQAIVIALHYCQETGMGQHIDVSAHQSMAWIIATQGGTLDWLANKQLSNHREGNLRTELNGLMRSFIFPCKDGFVCFYLLAGIIGARTNQGMVEWMESEGCADDLLRNMKWAEWDFQSSKQELIDHIQGSFGRFFLMHTKEELLLEATKRGMLLSPVCVVSDLANSPQLKSRQFWTEVEYSEAGDKLTYPGVCFLSSLFSRKPPRRAPLIGEHNNEVLAEKRAVACRQATDVSKGIGAKNGRLVFDGLKVVEFTQGLAGPLVGRLLADHGATVVHIESTRRPDLLRVSPPQKDNKWGVNRNVIFGDFEANKLGLTLDMDVPQASELAKKLIAWADVILDSRVPGVLEKWGLGYENIAKINPSAIVLRISNQGQTGPLSKHPGYGFHVVGQCGTASVLGYENGEPLLSARGGYSDVAAGRLGSVAMLAALVHRQKTGEGQLLDLAMVDGGINYIIPEVLDYFANGRDLSRKGNRCGNAAPHGAYPCRGTDAWCVIAVTREEEWNRFRMAIGDPAWAKDPKFDTTAERKRNENELDRLVGEWTRQFTPQEVMVTLQGAGVPAGAVKTIPEVCEDPQLQHRQHYQLVDHPEMEMYHVDTFSYHLSETPFKLQRGSPCLGQHNEYVCCKLLGVSDEEFTRLVSAGVFD